MNSQNIPQKPIGFFLLLTFFLKTMHWKQTGASQRIILATMLLSAAIDEHFKGAVSVSLMLAQE